MPLSTKLPAEEQGFYFATGVVMLVALLLAVHYHGPYEEAVRFISACMAFGDGWIVRDELCNPHWADDPEEPEDLIGRDFNGEPFEKE